MTSLRPLTSSTFLPSFVQAPGASFYYHLYLATMSHNVPLPFSLPLDREFFREVFRSTCLKIQAAHSGVGICSASRRGINRL